MNTFMLGPSFFSFYFLSFSTSFPKSTILRLYMACKILKITTLTRAPSFEMCVLARARAQLLNMLHISTHLSAPHGENI